MLNVKYFVRSCALSLKAYEYKRNGAAPPEAVGGRCSQQYTRDTVSVSLIDNMSEKNSPSTSQSI